MVRSIRSNTRARTSSNIPKRPADLTPVARKLWNEMLVHLEESGMLSKAIGPRLSVLCRTWADYRKASTYIRRYGFGGKHQAKASATIRNSYPVIMSCLREFGCTPLSRSRLRRQGGMKA